MHQVQCFAIGVFFAVISVAAVHAQGQDWGDSGAAVYNTPQGYKSQAEFGALPQSANARKVPQRSLANRRFLGACYYPDMSAPAGVGLVPDPSAVPSQAAETNCAGNVTLHGREIVSGVLSVTIDSGVAHPAAPVAMNGGLTLD